MGSFRRLLAAPISKAAILVEVELVQLRFFGHETVGYVIRQEIVEESIERYEDLKTSLLSRYPDGSVRSILFNGTSHGDGTSTTAVSFATDLSDQARGQE